MDLIIFIFFVVVFVIPGILKSAKRKSKVPAHKDYLASIEQSQDLSDNPYAAKDNTSDQHRELKQRIHAISANQAAALGRKKVIDLTRREKRDQFSAPNVKMRTPHNASDLNRARRSDWGQRVGPGILSSRNMVILSVIALALLLMGQVPSHLLR